MAVQTYKVISVKRIMLFDLSNSTVLTISALMHYSLPHIFQIPSRVGNPYSSSTSMEGVYDFLRREYWNELFQFLRMLHAPP